MLYEVITVFAGCEGRVTLCVLHCRIIADNPTRRSLRAAGKAGSVAAMEPWIFRLSPVADWERFRETGRFDGSAADRADGFIHFSAAAQVAASYNFV